MTKLIARSRAMREVMSQARRYAAADATVLITGETGTGKNLLAAYLHQSGPRRHRPFVTIDCASLPPTLAESDLFGHERGAFTDATSARPGRFELAGHGTVYLDAVHLLAPATQGALLRVVEERRAVRLGGLVPIDLNARLIASAEPTLAQLLESGAFRADLFHRLRVLTLTLPPLRERPDDILPLAHALVATLSESLNRHSPAIAADAADALGRYHWPGNVRELQHALHRALLTSDGDTLDATSFSDILEGSDTYLDASGSRRPTLEDVERRYITLTLRHVKGNQTRAATILGISRKALWEKRKRYGMG